MSDAATNVFSDLGEMSLCNDEAVASGTLMDIAGESDHDVIGFYTAPTDHTSRVLAFLTLLEKGLLIS